MLLRPNSGHAQSLEVVGSSSQGQERRYRRPGSQGNLEGIMDTLQLVVSLLGRWVSLLHQLRMIHVLVVLSEHHIIVRVYRNRIVASVQLRIIHLSAVSRW